MRVTGLFVHPIKSCRGIAVTEARVTRRGLANDRRYMVTDDTGRFVSQREEPSMATIVTTLEPGALVVEARGHAPLRLPLGLDAGERRDVSVWRHQGPAIVHDAGSAWFSKVLGRALWLAYQPDDAIRAVNPERGQPGDQVSFADGYPLLLASEASLADLSARVGAPVSMRRFRPNVVIDGDAPFVEDRMARFSLGAIRFRNLKPCDRCSIPALDPDTGERGVEPTRSLAKYRTHDGAVWFAVNLVPDDEGVLRVGDPVTVHETMPGLPFGA